MNELDRRVLLGAAGLAGVAAISRAGPLNPPAGAVAGTGRTTTEVYDKVARTSAGLAEARIPVQSLSGNAAYMYTINSPGSYYLTDNITAPNGSVVPIFMTAGATLDLNGYTVSTPTGGGQSVIAVGARSRVFNGYLIAGGTTANIAVSAGDDVVLHDLYIQGGLIVVAASARRTCGAARS
ncbi:MAG: hypothetical protein QM783_02070 [Phycisphaerales bacterium]